MRINKNGAPGRKSAGDKRYLIGPLQVTGLLWRVMSPFAITSPGTKAQPIGEGQISTYFKPAGSSQTETGFLLCLPSALSHNSCPCTVSLWSPEVRVLSFVIDNKGAKQ